MVGAAPCSPPPAALGMSASSLVALLVLSGLDAAPSSPYGKLGFPTPPDTRPPGCEPDGQRPADTTVTIVVPYLNEKDEHMQATVKSLVHFTPDRLIERIIFVSDGNKDPRVEFLQEMSPKLTVLVLPQRVGLIRAKMKGAELVTTPVVVFLEPHCVVNRRWLEPLLARLHENPHTVAMPVLDAIPQENFREYRRAAVGHFRLEWNFNLIYTAPADAKDSPQPYPSPATSGGIFAMRTDWFRKLELWDTGMRQWGGDHVELTMKAWRCGGRIEIIPCSRVGHMFRDAKHQPYPVKIEQIVKNYARLAYIWTDTHLEKFLKVKPEARAMKTGNLSHLHDQRTRLGCKDMDWYLRNVDVELGWEAERICIPGAVLSNGGCRGKAVSGRSTIDKLMPVEEYLRVREALSAQRSAGTAPPELAEAKWEAARIVEDDLWDDEL
mmetsp:Transcript_111903/g.311479  ORF Transcript_111903/g.311479 Transcript_111903/m.311479 type:complete len:438 (+) Transcript_111903:38-1351(+)